MRARVIERHRYGTTVEVTVRLDIIDERDGNPAYVHVLSDEVEHAARGDNCVSDPIAILPSRDGALSVWAEYSGLQWSEDSAATRALLTAICDAINAALAGANAKGGAA